MENVIIVVKGGAVQGVYGSNGLYYTQVEIIDLDTEEGKFQEDRAEAAENSMVRLA